jgi:hypothetical protein
MNLREDLRSHPIRAFALLCVACTSAFLGYMAIKLTDTLASPTWCSTALQAEKISPGSTFVGLTSCVDLLRVQLKSLAVNSHIVFAVFALCLLVLIVIVIAGGRLNFSASKTGVSANMGREEAAQETADAAQSQADEIKGATP